MGNIPCPRAWDDVLGKMLYSKVEQSDDSLMFRFEKHFETETPIYMWPTGLKDQNGKEIYEGDLLKNPPKDKWEETNFVAFEVFYHDNDCADKHVGFQMNRLHFQGSVGGYSIIESFLPKYTSRMEIIGNIYENPNLLEG